MDDVASTTRLVQDVEQKLISVEFDSGPRVPIIEARCGVAAEILPIKAQVIGAEDPYLLTTSHEVPDAFGSCFVNDL